LASSSAGAGAALRALRAELHGGGKRSRNAHTGGITTGGADRPPVRGGEDSSRESLREEGRALVRRAVTVQGNLSEDAVSELSIRGRAATLRLGGKDLTNRGGGGEKKDHRLKKRSSGRARALRKGERNCGRFKRERTRALEKMSLGNWVDARSSAEVGSMPARRIRAERKPD